MPRLLAQTDPTEEPFDAGGAVEAGTRDFVGGLLEQLPAIATAVVVLLLFVGIAAVVRLLVRRSLLKATDRSESFATVISGVARGATLLVGVLIAATIAFPGLDAGALVAGLGISSVAIGFAFADILQNTLAGLLLLFRQPFEIGDVIEVGDHKGVVEAITIRETRLKTFDGRRVLIPNQDVYSSSVEVQTAFESIRSSLVVGVDYTSDLEQARQVALDAIREVEGVLEDPAPQALYTELNVSTIDLDVRYWTSSQQPDVRATQDRAVEAVKAAYDAADLPMPADVVELEFREGLSVEQS
jgi:small conductance mechanosensitive channel